MQNSQRRLFALSLNDLLLWTYLSSHSFGSYSSKRGETDLSLPSPCNHLRDIVEGQGMFINKTHFIMRWSTEVSSLPSDMSRKRPPACEKGKVTLLDCTFS